MLSAFCEMWRTFILPIYLLCEYYQSNIKANWRTGRTFKGVGLTSGFIEWEVHGQMKGSGDGHRGGVQKHSSFVLSKGSWQIRKVGLIEDRAWNALESCHLILWATEDHVQAGREDKVVPAECHQRLGRGWNQQEQKGREGEVARDDWHRALLRGEKDSDGSKCRRQERWFCQTVPSFNSKELEGLLPAGGTWQLLKRLPLLSISHNW